MASKINKKRKITLEIELDENKHITDARVLSAKRGRLPCPIFLCGFKFRKETPPVVFYLNRDGENERELMESLIDVLFRFCGQNATFYQAFADRIGRDDMAYNVVLPVFKKYVESINQDGMNITGPVM